MTPLGTVEPKGSTWRRSIAAVRERDGALEAIVVVRPTTPRSPGTTWGALVRRGHAGRWEEITRFPLPDETTARVGFDADPGRLVLRIGSVTLARRLPA